MIRKITLGYWKGYKVSITRNGDHLHDDQLVQYDIMFISPDNKTTTIHTDMSLMTGWNIEHAVTIK